MRLAVALVLCSLTLMGANTALAKYSAKIATKDFLLKQKFLFEIVHRVEDPLAFEEWIKLGKELIVDKSKYTKYDQHMQKFYQAYLLGTLLPKDDFFGAVIHSHMQQAWGLFNYFYYAKDWETFQHNVCWARLHVNPGMFVYALNLAVIHRDDFEGLIMPAIYEIWPQHFFNAPFIYKAEKFDYDIWSKQVMYEKEFADIYYKSQKDVHDKPKYLKDWKMWQWWKLMGLEERWYAAEEGIIVRHNEEFVLDDKWKEAMRDVKIFWMPVDYTRDLHILNPESELSYYMEDVDHNAAWYYTNLDGAAFLDSAEFALHKDRHSEWWMYVNRMLLARLKLERLSNGLGDVEAVTHVKVVETGYNPQLISWNGIPFLQRYNNYEYTDFGFKNTVDNAWAALEEMYKAIDAGRYKLKNGTVIDMRTTEGYWYLHDMMHGNINAFNSDAFRYYYYDSFMYLGQVEYNKFYDILPSIFLNFETMWRDPYVAMFMNAKIIDVYRRYIETLPPYRHKELQFEGVEIVNAELEELVTYFDYSDIDVSNLLNDKMRFVDGQYQWDTALYARQQRLNHKPFGFKLHVKSAQPQRVVVRAFIAPKYNENGELIALANNYENFVQFDVFASALKAGDNVIERAPSKQFWKHGDRVSYTEMYHLLELALEDKYEFRLNISAPHSSFSRRLILPKGWVDGFPVQFFFMITPYTAKHEPYETFDWDVSAGIGSGTRFLDELPFGYPFDRRVIEERDFLVPNMYFKDAKVYHVNYAEKYKKGYEHYGKFDYHYWKAADIEV